MSTYELDDAELDALLDLLRTRASGWSANLARKLEEQRPVPVPVKVGAAVRTEPPWSGVESAVFVRWSWDTHTHSPWILAGNHEIPYRTDEIGRIVEVLSPGVDDA